MERTRTVGAGERSEAWNAANTTTRAVWVMLNANLAAWHNKENNWDAAFRYGVAHAVARLTGSDPDAARLLWRACGEWYMSPEEKLMKDFALG